MLCVVAAFALTMPDSSPANWQLFGSQWPTLWKQLGLDLPLLALLLIIWVGIKFISTWAESFLEAVSQPILGAVNRMAEPKGLTWIYIGALGGIPIIVGAVIAYNLLRSTTTSIRLGNIFLGELQAVTLIVVWLALLHNRRTFSGIPFVILTAVGAKNRVQLRWEYSRRRPAQDFWLVRNEHTFPLRVEDGERIYSGRATTFIDRDLRADAAYYYGLFTPNSRFRAVISAATLPPLNNVSNIKVIVDVACVTLRWTPPTDPSCTAVEIWRSFQPIERLGMGERMFTGLTSEYVDSGLVPGVTYNYAFYAVDSEGSYSDSVSFTAVPKYGDDVRNLRAVSQSGRITLSWDSPLAGTYSGATVTRIAQRSKQTVEFEVTDTEFADETVDGNTEYTYIVKARHVGESYSRGVSSSILSEPPPRQEQPAPAEAAISDATDTEARTSGSTIEDTWNSMDPHQRAELIAKAKVARRAGDWGWNRMNNDQRSKLQPLIREAMNAEQSAQEGQPASSTD